MWARAFRNFPKLIFFFPVVDTDQFIIEEIIGFSRRKEGIAECEEKVYHDDYSEA